MKYANYKLLYGGKNSKYSDMKEKRYANIGDNIQVLALDYVYEKMGIEKDEIKYIDETKKSDYDGEYLLCPAIPQCLDEISLESYLNMSERLVPVFFSLVSHGDYFASNPELINFFRRYEPIGCRDEHTLRIFRKYGIESYLTGCLTLCFPKRNVEPTDKKVFIVDVSDELMKRIPKEILEYSEMITHAVEYYEYPVTEQENKRLMEVTKALLRRYNDEATMVITGRLHVAVPCIAMGIPVIFAADNIDFRFQWIDKIIKLYSLGEYDTINWNPETVNVEDIKQKIFECFKKTLDRVKLKYEDLCDISYFFEERKKAKYYELFYDRVKAINAGQDFEYIIWGAGHHCRYAYEIICQVYPNARLICVVDKYKQGKKFGVDIIKPEEVTDKKFSHAIITTVPGKDEAIGVLEQLGKEYTLIISQMKS